MKPYLTRVAMFELLRRILKYSDSRENFVKSIFKPNIFPKSHNDKSGDFRVGRIVMLIKSDDGEIRKAILKTDHFQGLYPITNLRFLECHPKSNDKVYQQIIPNVQYRPKRQAAEIASAKLGQMVD